MDSFPEIHRKQDSRSLPLYISLCYFRWRKMLWIIHMWTSETSQKTTQKNSQWLHILMWCPESINNKNCIRMLLQSSSIAQEIYEKMLTFATEICFLKVFDEFCLNWMVGCSYSNEFNVKLFLWTVGTRWLWLFWVVGDLSEIYGRTCLTSTSWAIYWLSDGSDTLRKKLKENEVPKEILHSNNRTPTVHEKSKNFL